MSVQFLENLYHYSKRLSNAPLLLANNLFDHRHQETDGCNRDKGSFAYFFADLHLGHSMTNSVHHILTVQRQIFLLNYYLRLLLHYYKIDALNFCSKHYAFTNDNNSVPFKNTKLEIF